jgi:DNA-binding transcriptional LysR family regulator
VSIDVRHRRYATIAAEQGSFRRAALALGIRESAVSRRIRDLEDEIGATLFIRHSGGVKLTQAGEVFVCHARNALKQVSNATLDVGAIGRGETGVIRIGIFSSLASGFLAELLSCFCAQNSDVRIDLVEGAPSDHIAAVRQHRMDVAFVTGVPTSDNCDVSQFWSERVYVVVPASHTLAQQLSIRWSDLQDQFFVVGEADTGSEIYDFLVKHLANFGMHPHIERCCVGRDNLMQVVAFGRGLTLTSEATTATHFPGVVYKLLEDETLPFSAVWSPRNDNPAFRRFLSLARRLSKQDTTAALQHKTKSRASAT